MIKYGSDNCLRKGKNRNRLELKGKLHLKKGFHGNYGKWTEEESCFKKEKKAEHRKGVLVESFNLFSSKGPPTATYKFL